VHLRPDRDRSVRQAHPWILSGSIARVTGDAAPGDTVRVATGSGEILGEGDFDPHSQIRVRITRFGPVDEDAEESWLAPRIERAIGWRATHPALQDVDAVRLVHAEADGLPGLVIDRYAQWLSVKLATPAMVRRTARLAELLRSATGAEGAWIRGESAGAKAPASLGGDTKVDRALFGAIPDEPIAIRERSRRYWVDVKQGQKTGFYLDQRDARDALQSLASGARVLDLFAYTGGFAVAAMRGGAVSVVESSKPATEMLARNVPEAEIFQHDVNRFLREDARPFDVIALDPPPFAKRKHDVQSACRAYKDLNLRAMERIAPGGYLLTFTCSHHISPDLFRKVVFSAALDAQREVQVLAPLSAPVDHPVSIFHPQGEYLSGLLLRIEGPLRCA
jgi:23S rRNA (cytosine1962-C5)-methyltransferase